MDLLPHQGSFLLQHCYDCNHLVSSTRLSFVRLTCALSLVTCIMSTGFNNNNLDVLFKRDKVTVTKEDDNTALEGALDPTTYIYMVPLDNHVTLILSHLKGGGPPETRALKTKEMDNNRGKAYNTKNIANQVNMHHLALGSPTQATLIQAI